METAGWGSLNNLGGRPDKLQELSITVMERWLCGRSDYYGSKFTDNMLCAAEKRKDTCDVSFFINNVYTAFKRRQVPIMIFFFLLQGDSGGPLLYKGVVVGITSNGGRKCGSSRKPGLYTIISHYTQWIDRTTTQ